MTRAILLAAALLAAALPTFAEDADGHASLRVMTFNIRYDNPADGENGWKHRKDWLAEIVNREHPDIVGMQEVLAGQFKDLKERLHGMKAFGVGRDDGKQSGEFVPIFYREERYHALEHGTFWLSKTPDKPGSKDWDAAITRTVSWLKLKDTRSGDVFFAVNTHFDHKGKEAREKSAALVVERLRTEFAGHPVILTGDFNTRPDSPPYEILVGKTEIKTMAGEKHKDLIFRDSFLHSAARPTGPESTFNGFKEIAPHVRIDFIFVTPTIDVLKIKTLDDQKNGRFPSDHLPVVADVRIKK
jgi:endonuclease/exonuclease/phosphatase family metal-dependent hydrolase